jgi:hypothetical protein
MKNSTICAIVMTKIWRLTLLIRSGKKNRARSESALSKCSSSVRICVNVISSVRSGGILVMGHANIILYKYRRTHNNNNNNNNNIIMEVLQAETWSLSSGVHHWLKSRSTREERKPVTRDDNDDDDNNNNNRNITHHKESATSWDLKPEWWGSPLAQGEKYQGRK